MGSRKQDLITRLSLKMWDTKKHTMDEVQTQCKKWRRLKTDELMKIHSEWPKGSPTPTENAPCGHSYTKHNPMGGWNGYRGSDDELIATIGTKNSDPNHKDRYPIRWVGGPGHGKSSYATDWDHLNSLVSDYVRLMENI